MKKETLLEIGESIQQHSDCEISENTRIRAIGRAFGYMEATCPQPSMPNKDVVTFWLLQEPVTLKYVCKGDAGLSIYKNTKLGEILTKYYQGKHSYFTKTFIKKENIVSVEIYNRATFTLHPAITDVIIWLAGEEQPYSYSKLTDLLEEQRLLQRRKKLKEQEAANNRLQEERKKQEEVQRIKNEIEQLEKEITFSKAKIAQVKLFIRDSVALRLQPLLDESQETAKRSHLYDGVSMVIEGGPGTGKTTTVIQRLKFLTSKEALNDYEVNLSKTQIDWLTDEKSNSWMFISPTKLLLQYLRQNMQYEGLTTNNENTITVDDFREKMMREYQLCSLTENSPFKLFKNKKGYTTLILKPKKVANQFKKYIVQQIAKGLVEVSKLETKIYAWHDKAVRIKSYGAKAKDINTMESLLKLFYSLQENEGTQVEELVKVSNDKVKEASVIIGNKVKAHPVTVDELKILFSKWRKERMIDEDDTEEEEEETLAKNLNFETDLFVKLQPLVRRYALTQVDAAIKLSKRQQELYALVEPFMQDIQNWNTIGGLVWFVRKFANLCDGVERNVIKKLPQLYKSFRKEIDKTEGQVIYNQTLLKEIIQKDNNKRLHPDEQNLLLGFINNLLLGIYKKSKARFGAINHPYATAYKTFAKPVLVIDEATDYTQLDYYMLYSFRHYDVSSITLSGDIMQGLNEYGITSWNDLDWIIPDLEKYELKTSYRQLPTLLQIAKEMYKDDQGTEPNYQSYMKQSDNEPAPLAFISENEDEKVEWISKRIQEVAETYETIPSIALFVGEEENIGQLVERFDDLDFLNGIRVVDCSDNHLLEAKDTVRIFRLSEVKGMEFEVAFFYNIDQAIEQEGFEKLMRRYLYVGISRATTHLAATFMSREGNENILKYFNQESDWSH